MSYVIVKYIHFSAIMVLISSLCLEHFVVKSQLAAKDMRRLALIDGIYGLASAIVLGAGLFLWFVVGKGSSFYSSNPYFHLKLGLFVLVGLLSIYPTIFFLKHRKTQAEITVIPKSVVLVLRLELLLVLLIPLFAILMAQGHGLPVSQ